MPFVEIDLKPAVRLPNATTWPRGPIPRSVSQLASLSSLKGRYLAAPRDRTYRAEMDLELVGALVGLFFGITGFLYSLGGIMIVRPRTMVVVLRFGKYKKTISRSGVRYAFPLGRKLYRISSQDTSIDLPHTTVLEQRGNPVVVSAVCVYRVREARRAVLHVNQYHQFVHHLANVVVKSVCARFPYESKDPGEPCLKKESEVISAALVNELQELVGVAGVEVLQLRITDLAYSPEIAQAMLLRQQAEAMVEAMRKIVEGAVGTVRSALVQMHKNELGLPAEVTASLVSNLVLILCSGEKVQTYMPIRVETSSPRRDA